MLADVQTVKPRARRVRGVWFVFCGIAHGAHPDLDEAIRCWRANRLYLQRKHPRACK